MRETVPIPTPGHATAAVILLTIVVGLQVDQRLQPWGQAATSVWCWGLVFFLLRRASVELRWVMIACLLISTLGEVFASLIWGLYAYRQHNIPAFIPTGHLMMWLLGIYVAAHTSRRLIWAALAVAIGWTAYGVMSGLDQGAVPMLGLFLAALALGGQRRRYAATFLLAIALELYGTSVGNWRWVADAPWVHLSMTNPPLCAGGLYCLRDVLVGAVARWVHAKSSRRQAAAATNAAASGSAAGNC